MKSNISSECLIDDMKTPLKFCSSVSLDNKEEEEKRLENDRTLKPRNNHLGMCSFLLFSWVSYVIDISNRSSLKLIHLFSLNISDPIVKQFNRLYTSWYGTPMTLNGYELSKSCCPLFRAILKSNCVEIYLVIFISLTHSGARLLLINIMRKLIKTFRLYEESTEKDASSMWIYTLSGGLLLNKFIVSILEHHTNYLSERLGVKASGELLSLIYEKIMRTGAFFRNSISEGELINYIQADIETIGFMFFYAPMTIVVPFQIGMSIWMLYNYFGSSFNFGLFIFFILISIAWGVQKKYISNQRKLLEIKDSRIKVTSNTFHMLKVIKMYSWEEEFIKRVDAKREEELKLMKKIQNVFVLSNLIHWAIPLILSMTSIGVYTLLNGTIPIENLLMAIQIFDSLSYPLYRLPIFITSFLNTLLSMKRIEKMLKDKDIENHSVCDLVLKREHIDIKLSNCNFGIANDKKSGVNKVLLSDINLEIKRGEMVAVLGETGSGKTCLANSILNCLDLIPNKNKPNERPINVINGTVGYASQNPWIMNESIRNNILFYSEMNKKTYNEILGICQLTKDLENLPGGEMTEVSSNGNNISGGQKSRISLARAIYSDADIYLFDDPLSSVDSIISYRIFNQVLMSYLKGKTRILFKHDINNLHQMDKIIYLDQGRVKWSGTYEQFKETDLYLDLQKKSFNKHDEENIRLFRKRNSSFKSLDRFTFGNEDKLKLKGKLIQEEEKKEGKISYLLYLKFFKLMGGYFFIFFLLFMCIVWEGTNIFGNMWLMKWASKSVVNSNNLYYFLVYCEIGIFSLLFLFIKEFLLAQSSVTVNKLIHNKMFRSLMYAPINLFHDIVPIGQSINRLTNDLDKSKMIIKQLTQVLKAIATLLGSIVVCATFNIYSLIFAPIMLYLGFKVTGWYINAGRDLNRLDNISKSPIVSSFSETIQGIITIRAYNTQSNFIDKFFSLQNNRYIVSCFKFASMSWYVLRLELCSFFYLFFIIGFSCIFKDSFSAQAIALMLKYSFQFSEEIANAFEVMTNIEKSMVSFERCDDYIKIIQEKNQNLPTDKSLKSWPSAGEIAFLKYSARYRAETDTVLNKIDIKIQPGEKVGIVGRSGSGKSTLFLALFRIIEPLIGTIKIDNVDITKIGLKKLRKAICIVPQEPIIIEGTLKDNLDPIHRHSDREMMKVLMELDFFNFMNQGNHDIAQGLKMPIKECGNNLSLGEKQLVCFARAILIKAKIIILDEATASVDQNTEEIIQKTIEKHFKNCTVITIAHKVKTVLNCDKIIVMDQGNIVEFDTPSALLQKANGHFARLYYKNMQIITNSNQ